MPTAKSKLPVESATKYPDLTEADTVAFSSRLIAAARAIESRRSDRLFNDPFAELLVSHAALTYYRTIVWVHAICKGFRLLVGRPHDPSIGKN